MAPFGTGKRIMQNLRFLLVAARVVALLVIIGGFVKIAPSLASHATGHATTYSAAAPAPSARGD